MTASSETVLESETDVEDFVAGTNLLSGAGGTPHEALELLLESLREGHRIGWSSIDHLADDALIVAAYFVGSVDPEVWLNRSDREAQLGLTRRHRRPLIRAVEHLEMRLGKQADAVVAIEIGASNTAAAVDVGARLGRMVVDGDYAGRAIPSLDCTTPGIHSQLQPPSVLADYYGDIVEITEAAGVGQLESISKMVAKATMGRIGCAGMLLTAADARSLVVRGTLTASLEAGRMLRRARASGGDVVTEVVAGLRGARQLFRGTLTKTEWDSSSGYMVGYHHVAGAAEWAGREMKIFFQNENHLAWIDGEPVAMSPDVIELVDAKTAEPQVNTFLEVGQDVVAIGLPRSDGMSTPLAIAALGPARWGFDLPFVPLDRHPTGD